MKGKLKIAVRTLIEHVFRSGDLELEFQGSIRPMEAIRAHQLLQNSRPESYLSEVSVSHELETDQFLLEINGRIDGVFFKPDRVVIEEIKTTTRSLAYYEHNENTLHWGQLKSYACIYAMEHGLEEIEAQLTYYHLETGETLEFRRGFATAELKDFFQEVIHRYLQWMHTIIEWGRLRDKSIRNVEFPYAEFRPGQRDMAVAIYRTIKHNGQFIIQAATGIGKTMAAIFPAIKVIVEGINPKIFYLTARTTGQAAAEKALDIMRNKGLRIKSLTLTAKDKICPNPYSACNGDECEFARGYYDRVSEALKEIFNLDAFSRSTVDRIAREYVVCPFEFSLELSLWADCIICDYNYAFDPRVFLRRFFVEENGDYTFLIDEAHNLVDRSREMFSAEICKQTVLDVRRTIKKELPQLYKHMGKINSWMVKARKKCENSGNVFSEKDPPTDLFPLLRNFLKTTERWLSLNLKTSFREALLDLYFEVSGFLRVAEQYDDSYATCFEQVEKELKVKLFCIDPSRQLEEALRRCRAAIFFSATMTPASYFKKILGCETGAGELTVPSPFPEENLGLFISDRVSTLYRHRDKTKSEVNLMLLSFVKQKTGNYLLFFPSYEYMRGIHSLFEAESPEIKTIVQNPGMTEPERDVFLGRFHENNPDTLVGFAVMGGIFGEGIDLVGDRLSGVAIVGVGLPKICLERELIREYFAKNNRYGFEYAYLYPGINRVLQAAGRVLRSEQDRGTVLLIDQRFSSLRYRSLFPPQWHPVMVQGEIQLGKVLKKFWGPSYGSITGSGRQI